MSPARIPGSQTSWIGHGALTNGGYPVAKACFAHGVDTVVYIHIDYGELQRLRAEGAVWRSPPSAA